MPIAFASSTISVRRPSKRVEAPENVNAIRSAHQAEDRALDRGEARAPGLAVLLLSPLTEPAPELEQRQHADEQSERDREQARGDEAHALLLSDRVTSVTSAAGLKPPQRTGRCQDMFGRTARATVVSVVRVPSCAPAMPAPPATTYVDASSEFTGTLKLAKSLHVDGAVEGEIDCAATVTIGSSGKVNAQIRAESVVIDGEIHGDIEARSEISSEQDRARLRRPDDRGHRDRARREGRGTDHDRAGQGRERGAVSDATREVPREPRPATSGG